MVRSSICVVASLSLAALASACSTTSCKTYGAPGLHVTVTDISDTPVCDASVTADDGDFSEVLKRNTGPVGEPCFYLGVFERPGTYTVTAWNGKQMGLASKLKVSKDACHVKTVTTKIRTGLPA
jgi:hypothetical protein